MITRIFRSVDAFFFARISDQGFGLMRIMWALTALLWMGMQIADITEFYSESGVLPGDLQYLMLRGNWRFTILHWITTPDAVLALYVLLLFSLTCMMVGIAPRISTIASVILLASFHERNPLPLGGGDTVLRVLGVLLVIAPSLDAFSLKRLQRQWTHWHGTGRLLPTGTMPVWPYRLVLWQLLVIYATSVWFKLMGSMWVNGTAVASALHHPTFSRLPKPLADALAPFTPLVDFTAIAWQAMWLLLLIPKPLVERVLPQAMLKRGILLGGIWFHGSIFLMMDAGSFSMAMFAAYAGMLTADDFRALRDCINGIWMGHVTRDRAQRKSHVPCPMSPVVVLYDGRCAFCQKSIFLLRMLDSLRRLRCVNFYDAAARKEIAPDLPLEALKKEMYVVVPKGEGRSVKGGKPRTSNVSLRTSAYGGFYAFRRLARHLPALWPAVPLLHVPGVPFAGRHVYAFIAARRHGKRA